MAISLNPPMILAKAIVESGFDLKNKNRTEEEKQIIHDKYFELLRHYLLMVENIHVRTYDYIANMPASINPMMFTQGLAWNGHLKPTDKIEPCLKAATMSYGYVGLNELQELWNGNSLVEDGDFAYETLQYLEDFKNESKDRTHINMALYSTPAESLAGTQVKQFRQKYGLVENVSDREYFTNSFHMPVWADISPIQKQDLEERFFKIPAGGRIQYVRIPNSDNYDATSMLIDRGIKKGFYQGVNLAKSYCDHGHQFFESDYSDFNGSCPICGSDQLVTVNRVCGYLGYSRVKGDTRMNDAKLAEIADRKSM
jgi:ribonucleoside-triphosphate reductase